MNEEALFVQDIESSLLAAAATKTPSMALAAAGLEEVRALFAF